MKSLKLDKKIIWLVIGVVGLFIFLTLSLFIYQYPLPRLFSDIQMVFLKSDLFEKSTVKVSLDENYLSIKFNILDKDKKTVAEFLSNSDLSPDVLSGVSIEIDQNSTEKIRSFLPIEASVLIRDKKLLVFSKNQRSLKSSELGREIKYATNDAEVSYKKISSTQFRLHFENPKVLLTESTMSGKLHLSKKAETLSKFLQNVSIMNLEINGKNVSGEIILK